MTKEVFAIGTRGYFPRFHPIWLTTYRQPALSMVRSGTALHQAPSPGFHPPRFALHGRLGYSFSFFAHARIDLAYGLLLYHKQAFHGKKYNKIKSRCQSSASPSFAYAVKQSVRFALPRQMLLHKRAEQRLQLFICFCFDRHFAHPLRGKAAQQR